MLLQVPVEYLGDRVSLHLVPDLDLSPDLDHLGAALARVLRSDDEVTPGAGEQGVHFADPPGTGG